MDDLLVAAPDFPTLKKSQAILDELAAELGVEFKPSKDEGFDTPTTTIEYLGI